MEISDMMRPDAFYVDGHQRIYKAMHRLAQANQPIDIHTVCEELRKTEDLESVGGAYYIAKLTNTVVSSAHLISHCRILIEKFVQREVIRICGNLIRDAYDDSTDAFDLLDAAESDVFSIRQSNLRQQFRFLDAEMIDVLRDLEEQRHEKRMVTGIPSGHEDIDRVTCGWQGGDLIILAARPSVGKTSLALHLAKNGASGSGKSVAIFSMEMKSKMLTKRIMAAESGIWLWRINNSKMEDEHMKILYSEGVQKLAPVNIIIDDTPAIEVGDFRAKARRLVAKHNCGMIVVDYLQLMSAASWIQNREQQISYISRNLKQTASELNIPIIALAQLSREIEKNKWREPVLADLRESGAIEQDADQVAFLWPPNPETVITNPTLAESIFLGIKKNRNGALASFLGKFKKEIQRWEYFSVVDNTTDLNVLGDNWKPVKDLQGKLIDFSQSKREQQTEWIDQPPPPPADDQVPPDLPF